MIGVEGSKELSFRDFINDFSAKGFVELHGAYCHDYYLESFFEQEYGISSEDIFDLYDKFDLWSLIEEKYIDFLTQLGLEKSIQYFNEQFTQEEIEYLLGMNDGEDFDVEEFLNNWHEIVGGTWSSIGYVEFFGALINEYELFVS